MPRTVSLPNQCLTFDRDCCFRGSKVVAKPEFDDDFKTLSPWSYFADRVYFAPVNESWIYSQPWKTFSINAMRWW